MVAIVTTSPKKKKKKEIKPWIKVICTICGWGENRRNAATLPDSDFYPPSIHCSSCPYSILP
jgi:hypothetical protein